MHHLPCRHLSWILLETLSQPIPGHSSSSPPFSALTDFWPPCALLDLAAVLRTILWIASFHSLDASLAVVSGQQNVLARTSGSGNSIDGQPRYPVRPAVLSPPPCHQPGLSCAKVQEQESRRAFCHRSKHATLSAVSSPEPKEPLVTELH